MIPSVRDAIIRITLSHEYESYSSEIKEHRQNALQSLSAMDPTDVINIARTQGRIHAFDEVLRLESDAITELELSKGTSNA